MKHPEARVEQRQIRDAVAHDAVAHDAVAMDLAGKETIEAKSAGRAVSVDGPIKQLTVDAS
jgi:hypothetical protein